MTEGNPRSPAPVPLTDQERVLVNVGLITLPIALALMTLAVGGDTFGNGNRAPVTVQGLADTGENPRSPAGLPADVVAPGQRLGDGLALSPRVIENRVAGYVIQQGSDLEILSATKLRHGDLIIDLDGEPLVADRVETLGAELAAADSVEVTYERDGQIRRRLIRLKS